MRMYSQIAERNVSYAKILPESAMRMYSQIAERSVSYAKIFIFSVTTVYPHDFCMAKHVIVPLKRTCSFLPTDKK